MRTIRYSDIFRRKLALESTVDPMTEASCRLYEDRAKNPKATVEDAVKYLSECSKYPSICTKNTAEIFDIAKKYKNDTRVINLVESIVPRIQHDYTRIDASYLGKDETLRIENEIAVNKACDRILENDKNISKKFDIESFVVENKNPEMITNKCCSVVDNFNLPLRGKIAIAIEEVLYLTDKNNISVNKKQVVDTASSYFLMRENSVGQVDSINKAIYNNPYITEDGMITGATPSALQSIELFRLSPEKNSTLLQATLNDIVSSPSYEIQGNMSAFFYLLREILVSSTDEDLCTSVYTEIIPAIYDKVYEAKGTAEDLKVIATSIKSLIAGEIESINLYIKRYEDENVSNRMSHYLEALQDILEKFQDLADMAYSQYNIECMYKPNTIAEASAPITLNEYKIFKHENLIRAAVNIDKNINQQMKINDMKNKIKIKKLKSEIFGESVYDEIDSNGAVDYIACTLECEHVSADIQDKMTNICKEINNGLLAGTDMTCYYEADMDTEINIHVKEDCIVSLNDTEKEEYERHMTPEEITKAAQICALADLGDIDTSTDDMIHFFSQQDNDKLFSTFTEIASYANMDKEYLKSLFENIRMKKDDDNKFYHENYYAIESYSPKDAPMEIQLEAMSDLHKIIYENDYAKSKKNYETFDAKYNEDDEDKDDDDDYNYDDDEEDEKEAKKNTSNLNNDENDDENVTGKDIKKDKESQDKNIKEKKETSNDILTKMNNARLYLMGLNQKAKDFGAKAQGGIRNINASVQHFVNSY
jgi:hypothetical protein